MVSEIISSAVRSRIIRRLKKLTREEKIRILYACESGSRAWGFPSKDSDYDVRFVYVRPHNWYLSIDVARRSDTIERPIEDEIDLTGWDLGKALNLMRKSNPPLLEWLRSPIVYAEEPEARGLKRLATKSFSPISCAWHYLSMARTNFRAYLRGASVHPKKYFYVLRPLFAVRWIETGKGAVPMEFETLTHGVLKPGELLETINDLVRRKKSGRELDRGPRIAVLHHFIEQELARLEKPNFPRTKKELPMEAFNQFFRKCMDIKLSRRRSFT
jgi:uncharacterized protein